MTRRAPRSRRNNREPVEDPGIPRQRRPKQRYSRGLIEETIKVWQPYYDAPLSEEDATEIIRNMTAFASALLGLGVVRPRAGISSDSEKSQR